MDVLGCEIARVMWVGQKKIIPMSFKIPRKTRRFVSEFYPDDFAGIPAQDGADWLKGSNKPPVLTSLDPKKKDSSDGKKRSSSTFTIAKSRVELERELASALEEIEKVEKMKKDLLAKLAAAGIEPEKVDESKLPPPPPEPVKTVKPARPVSSPVFLCVFRESYIPITTYQSGAQGRDEKGGRKTQAKTSCSKDRFGSKT